MQLVHPLPQALALNYAQAIQHQSIMTGINPLTIITIIKHESDFNYGAVSHDGFDVGLMQVRARHYNGKREWLFDGVNNIRAGTHIIKDSIDFCRKFLGREPEFQEWMSCYQGSCTNPAHFCKPTHLTQVFEDYQICIAEDMSKDKSSTECRFRN
jgi:hypothetical protein